MMMPLASGSLVDDFAVPDAVLVVRLVLLRLVAECKNGVVLSALFPHSTNRLRYPPTV